VAATAIRKQTLAGRDAAHRMMRQLFALSESYPDLKANTNFLQLQGELANTENPDRASSGSRTTRWWAAYNAAVLSFPASLIAGPSG